MKQIHNIALPDASTEATEENRLAADLAQQGLLGSDGVDVQQLKQRASDLSINGLIRASDNFPIDRANDDYRPKMVKRELEELEASEKGPLPLFKTGETWRLAGFYEFDSVNLSSVGPVSNLIWRYQGSLSRAGTRSSHWRAVEARGVRDVTHPFGSTSTERIGLPDTATRTRWLHPTEHTTDVASQSAAFQTAFGDAERYDLVSGESAVGADDPTLIYDIPYGEDVIGPRVYDNRGNADKFDSDNIRQWQSVHETQHDIEDEIVISSGRIRWRITQPDNSRTGTDTVEEWSSSGGWSQTSLTSSDYKPYDVDIIENTQQRIRAQVTFFDTSKTTSDRIYTLELAMDFADRDLHLFRPPSESNSVPSGIESRYDPVAADTERDVQSNRTLVPREDVRL